MSKFTKLERNISWAWICTCRGTKFQSSKFSTFSCSLGYNACNCSFHLSKLLDVPFSMGAHAYDLFRKGGDWLLNEKFLHASMIRTSSNSSSRRLFEIGLDDKKDKSY